MYVPLHCTHTTAHTRSRDAFRRQYDIIYACGTCRPQQARVNNPFDQLCTTVSKFIYDRPSGSNDITEIHKPTTCMHLTQESSTSSQYTITQSCVAHRLTVSSPPGQPDHTPTRVGVPCVPPHVPSTHHEHAFSLYAERTTFAGQCPDNTRWFAPGHTEINNPARLELRAHNYYRGLRDARRVAVPKSTRAGIAAWRICRYNLDTVPDARHTNKPVEDGVQTSCPFQYNIIMVCVC